jgi:hypothetical protein
MIDAATQRITLTVQADHLQALARPAAYRMTNSFLRQHDVFTRHLGMRPNKLLVYLVIVVATVQRLMRGGLPPHWLGTARIHRGVVGFISRRGIAGATGLPRENVRRIVEELTTEDRLIFGPRGAIANKGGVMERPETMPILVELAHEVAESAALLIRLGIITIEQAPQLPDQGSADARFSSSEAGGQPQAGME